MSKTKIKFEFTGETMEFFGHTLRRIVCVTAFGSIAAGQIGGWIESEKNLKQVSGNAWVSGDAKVYGDAEVSGDAKVSGNAKVYGNAKVSGCTILRTGVTKTSTDFVVIGPQGSRNSFATYHIESDTVCTGCFMGSLNFFSEKVTLVYGDNKYNSQYQRVIHVFEMYQKK